MTDSGPSAKIRQPGKLDLRVIAHPGAAYLVGGLLIAAALVLGVTLRVQGVDGPWSYLDIALGALGVVTALWPRNVERLIRHNEALTGDVAAH